MSKVLGLEFDGKYSSSLASHKKKYSTTVKMMTPHTYASTMKSKNNPNCYKTLTPRHFCKLFFTFNCKEYSGEGIRGLYGPQCFTITYSIDSKKMNIKVDLNRI